ncbi:MFS transporter [Cellulomonas sp. Leaf334]|uniref:MFS transporter n=1 Tax=Cellulomonas sp. Leaf334 TaxID=1736339 RepID=UPI0006F9E2B6|nr:MFS transporter [Cellulomonas sp. Leaf334]KQR17224.1 hypothetical protein ASF78_07965 [Cellulomonas sp. Leaf334]
MSTGLSHHRSVVAPGPAPTAKLWFVVFLAYLALGGTVQLLPASLGSRFGSSTAFIGLAVGIAFGATALCRPIAGWASDAGAGKQVVVLGAVLTSAGAIGQALAVAEWQVLAARIVMGAGEAAVFSGALPWVLHRAPKERRGSISGIFGMSMWSGLAAGPLIVGLALHAGERLAWVSVAFLGLASAGVAIATPRAGAIDLPHLRMRSLWPRRVGAPAVLFGLAAYGYGTISAVLVLYLSERVGGAHLGLTVFAAAFLVARAAGSRAVDRYGAHAVAVGTLVVEAAGFAVLITASGVVGALTGVALVGAGCSLAFPATVGITLARAGDRSPGVAVAAVTSFWDAGVLAAGVAGGLLVVLVDYEAAFVAALLASLLALVAAIVLRRARSEG